jgi:hypothetical protein
MSAVFSRLAGAFDATLTRELEKSQHYKNTKANLKADAEYVRTVEKVAAFIGMGGFAFTLIGLGCCASRREDTGGVMICGAVPLAILSYDCYQASENFRTQVDEDPLKLMVVAGVNDPVVVNFVELRKCLLNKTLFFEPCLSLYASHCLKNTMGKAN